MSYKGTLLNIAALLYRDTTPKISPITMSSEESIMTSEGALNQHSGKSQDRLEKLASSEGGRLSPIVNDIFKMKITPITTLPKCIHPVLYKTPIGNIHPNLVVKRTHYQRRR